MVSQQMDPMLGRRIGWEESGDGGGLRSLHGPAIAFAAFAARASDRDRVRGTDLRSLAVGTPKLVGRLYGLAKSNLLSHTNFDLKK